MIYPQQGKYILGSLLLISEYQIFVYCIRWYFPNLNRTEAENGLLGKENRHGAFLIRNSESEYNNYSLSGKHYAYEKYNLFKWYISST